MIRKNTRVEQLLIPSNLLLIIYSKNYELKKKNKKYTRIEIESNRQNGKEKGKKNDCKASGGLDRVKPSPMMNYELWLGISNAQKEMFYERDRRK